MKGCIRPLLFFFVLVYKWYLTCSLWISSIENNMVANPQKATSLFSHLYGFTLVSERKPGISKLLDKPKESIATNSISTRGIKSSSRRTCTVGSLI